MSNVNVSEVELRSRLRTALCAVLRRPRGIAVANAVADGEAVAVVQCDGTRNLRKRTCAAKHCKETATHSISKWRLQIAFVCDYHAERVAELLVCGGVKK